MNGALFSEFPPVSTAEWEAAILKDLKGGDPKKLVWKTEDGFDVKPFYRMEDAPGLPAFSDFPKGWRICSEVETHEDAAEVMARGAQAILVRPKDAAALEALLARVPLHQVEVHVRAGEKAAALLPVLGRHAAKLRGSIDAPPPAPGFSGDFVPFVIDGDRFAALEPTTTQELALMLAVASEYLAAAGAGIANQIAFDFPLGTNYFFEIAKLRAARLLWPAVVAAYSQTVRPATRIYAHTGGWSRTIYDAQANMLRATTETMSAVIGGAELVSVTPFNSSYAPADEFSRRMGVNTQLVLREEAHFDELSDPASGSWYIESLTDRMAQQAWKIFQAIEAAGGYAAASEGNFIDELVRPARENRRAMIAQRRKLFTGINTHANPKERVLENIARTDGSPRGAAGFEHLRLNAERHEKATGRSPRLFLLRWGDPRMRRARAEFTGDFFACGGFEIADRPAFSSIEEAIAAIAADSLTWSRCAAPTPSTASWRRRSVPRCPAR
jgi:methylmalonyl-CoA mutase